MENNTANEVDIFIKRLRDGLIKIDDKAQTIYYEYGIGQKSLSYILGDKISSYESSREKPDPYYNPSSSDIKMDKYCIYQWGNNRV